MKIESNTIDPKSKSGSIKLIPNNSDDIYYLSLIILPGDRVSSYTTRKISLDGGKTQQKKTMKLEIKVESAESDLEAGIMYVKGKTCCENEFVRIGSYHTIDISVGNGFVLNKTDWKNSDIAKIKECCKEVPEIGFVVFFEKDCVLSTVSSNDIKTVYKEEIKNKNFKEIILNTIKIKNKVKNVVIASTSDIRAEFYKLLVKQDPSIDKVSTMIKLTGDYKGLPNSKVISKILSDKSMLTSLQHLKFVDDLREVQKFFNTIDLSREEVCIGLKEVSEAMDYGAIKILFVTDKFCKPKTVPEREFADAFIRKAGDLRAKICIIPIGLDLGQRLESIGNVACSLSFNYK
ncbi:uncharacterized protein VICG_00503 [Vittaforma corneae ATCC 50505]|uniref:eRF1/Pelota-like N-terminal domain-containing protein n=1 Tax=Vittaforma corneae (strain ATCC 50505) TaxID=993615 RepID=L2GP46_VITCO|nr:uncharacterized protein VICG_00503 [Vittaforma corneae ATCC 50505]ELA42404.1 hypothetical protein VICG_00503 [Vittaforma corneae ATCC 50505]